MALETLSPASMQQQQKMSYCIRLRFRISVDCTNFVPLTGHFRTSRCPAWQPCSLAALQSCSLAAGSLAACSLAVFQLAALWPCSLVAMQPRGPAVCSLALATLQRSVPWEHARRTGTNPFFGHARRRCLRPVLLHMFMCTQNPLIKYTWPHIQLNIAGEQACSPLPKLLRAAPMPPAFPATSKPARCMTLRCQGTPRTAER